MPDNKKITSFLIVWISLVSFVSVQAQNCPSLLLSHLNPVGDSSWEYGVELRSWLYGVQKEASESNLNDGYFYGAADFMIAGELSPAFFTQFQGLVRHKPEAENCRFGESGIYFTLKQASVEWASSVGLLRMGRQNFQFGQGLVLDHWFDGIEWSLPIGRWDARLFSGLFATDVARACQREAVFEHLQCWKQYCEADYGDFGLAGISFEGRIPGFRKTGISLMYQHASGVISGDLSAWYVSLELQNKLPGGWTSYFEGAYQSPPVENDRIPKAWGLKYKLMKFFKIRQNQLQIQAGMLYGSGEHFTNFSPLFERTRWGERQRYTARQGAIVNAGFKLTPHKLESFSFFADYFYHSERDEWLGISDELDFGFRADLFEGFSTWLVFTLLNAQIDLPQTRQLKIESRFAI